MGYVTPGSTMVIDNGATVKVSSGARITVFDPYEYMTDDKKYNYYPVDASKNLYRIAPQFDFAYNSLARLEVNGVLQSSGNIGGRVINLSTSINVNPYFINYVLGSSSATIHSMEIRQWKEGDHAILVTTDIEKHEIGNTDTIEITALVKDRYNNPVIGKEVIFSKGEGKGSLSELTSLTNTEGKATVNYTTSTEENEGTLILNAKVVSLDNINSNAKIEVKKKSGGDSCPLIYSFDGVQYLREHEPVTFSVNKAFEDTTFGTLRNLKEVEGFYKVRVTEEMESDTFVNALALYAVDYNPENVKEIFTDITGRPRTIKNKIAPKSFKDSSGNEMVSKISSKGELVKSDASNLEKGKYIESYVATFKVPLEGINEGKLMISTMATELYGGFGKWFANIIETQNNVWWLEHALPKSPSFVEFIDALSMLTMKVEVWDGKEWLIQAHINGGSHILEEFLIPIDLSNVRHAQNEIRIRLTTGSGFYIIDQVSIDLSTDEEVTIHNLTLESALKNSDEEVKSIVSDFENGKYIKLVKGEHVDFYYNNPPLKDGEERGFTVAFKGYFHPGQDSVEIEPSILWENMSYEEIIEDVLRIRPETRESLSKIEWLEELASSVFMKPMEYKIEKVVVKYTLPYLDGLYGESFINNLN